MKLGSSQEMKRSRLVVEVNQSRKGEEEEADEEEERVGDAEEEDEEEGGAHDTITSLAGAKMLQKYNKKLQYRGNRLAGSKPGSIHQLESLFKEEDKIPEEDEKPFLADAEVEEDEVAGACAAIRQRPGTSRSRWGRVCRTIWGHRTRPRPDRAPTAP